MIYIGRLKNGKIFDLNVGKKLFFFRLGNVEYLFEYYDFFFVYILVLNGRVDMIDG